MDPQLMELNRIFSNLGPKKPIYDDWLEKYQAYLETSKGIPIITWVVDQETIPYTYRNGVSRSSPVTIP